jgi:hypothetical protein
MAIFKGYDPKNGQAEIVRPAEERAVGSLEGWAVIKTESGELIQINSN